MNKIPLGINITDLTINFTLADSRQDDIVGFAELHFYENEKVILKVKGVVLKIKLFPNETEYKFSVNFPAYPSSYKKFNTSFIIENKSLHELICKAVIESFKSDMEQKGANNKLSPKELLESIRIDVPDNI